ncbi:MAG: 50S ribosomal protein L24 [Chloroflexi bacterium]|jgi:large subunit ribosomal protein L24|nr:50S ribosomal protein L24 [Chloroflexota bacterium]
MQRVKKEDTVLVTKGKDRGRSGPVKLVIPGKNRVIVTGINIVKRHMRPRGPQQPGGIIEREAPISLANVRPLCPSCDKPVRVGFRVLADGRKVRYCKKCDANFD